MFANLINSLLPRTRAATVQTFGHPAAGIIGWYNPDDNTSGEVVTETTALKYAALWCGVRIISETLASLPCILYRRRGTDKERATDDPRYSLVHGSLSDELDSYHFFEVSTAHMVLWGNSYAKIVRSGLNMPLELDLRLPDRTRPARRKSDGQLIYECTDPRETIEAPDMLHGVGFSFDGIDGYSLVKMAAQSLGISIAADKYAGSSLKNGAVPSGVLSHPAKLDKPAREQTRREWEEIHSNAGKAGRLAIVHGGITYQAISMSHEDAQLLESRKFGINEIARWLRIPPHMLADLQNSTTRSNIEQQALEFVTYSMVPWIKRWEGTLGKKLLRENERGTHYFEFLLDALLRSDTLTRYQAHALGRQWGFRSINEIKGIENENGIGPDGDVYLQPLNMVPAGTPPPVGQQASIPGTVQREWMASVTDNVRKIVNASRTTRKALEAGLVSVNEAYATLNGHLDVVLSGNRQTQELVKQEISTLGDRLVVAIPQAIEGIVASSQAAICGTLSSEAQGIRDGIQLVHADFGSLAGEITKAAEYLSAARAAATGMLAEELWVLLTQEAGQATKAATRQIHESRSFVTWVDEYYASRAEHVASRLAKRLAIHPSGNKLDAMAAAAKHIERSRSELLAAADGDRDGFEGRVQACVERWTTERIHEDAAVYAA